MKKLILCVLLSVSATATFAEYNVPRVELPGDIAQVIRKAQDLQVKGVDGQNSKGWTCRDPEDGHRQHRVDPTGIAQMNGVPSSKEALWDMTTPVENLSYCTTPK